MDEIFFLTSWVRIVDMIDNVQNHNLRFIFFKKAKSIKISLI